MKEEKLRLRIFHHSSTLRGLRPYIQHAVWPPRRRWDGGCNCFACSAGPWIARVILRRAAQEAKRKADRQWELLCDAKRACDDKLVSAEKEENDARRKADAKVYAIDCISTEIADDRSSPVFFRFEIPTVD